MSLTGEEPGDFGLAEEISPRADDRIRGIGEVYANVDGLSDCRMLKRKPLLVGENVRRGGGGGQERSSQFVQ